MKIYSDSHKTMLNAPKHLRKFPHKVQQGCYCFKGLSIWLNKSRTPLRPIAFYMGLTGVIACSLSIRVIEAGYHSLRPPPNNQFSLGKSAVKWHNGRTAGLHGIDIDIDFVPSSTGVACFTT